MIDATFLLADTFHIRVLYIEDKDTDGAAAATNQGMNLPGLQAVIEELINEM
jgi:hypothetical protein